MTDQILKGVDALALVGGDLALDFANTVHEYDSEQETDELQTYEDLIAWTLKANAIPAGVAKGLRAAARQSADATRALTRARRLRRSIYNVFHDLAGDNTPDRSDLDVIQRVWIDALGASHLEGEDRRFELEFDLSGKDLTEPLYPVANAAIRLLQSDETGRIRGCHADDCTWLFVDRSKNASRRWCQMDVCGNRAKARRHYHRNRETLS